MKLDTLYVYIHLANQGWIPCGVLTHLDSGRSSSSAFAYSKKYLSNSNRICIDPHQIPLSENEKSTEEGFSIFNGLRDSSPDAWGRYVMSKKFPSTALGELHYLAATNPDRIGALAYGPNPIDGPKKWTPDGWIDYDMKYLDLSTNTQGIDDLLKENKDTEAYKNVTDFASGSGGARPKANVIWGGELHLAKFSISTDPYNIPALEYATMSLARDCGIDIPDIDLGRALDRDVFLIKRFDRDKNLTPSHFASGLTLTNIHENEFNRYQYRELCDAIVTHSSNFEEDLKKLYRRVAFNIMVNNNDDHLRNYGFLYDSNQKWRLSPHYDVVPAQNTTGGSCALSLSLEGGKEASKNNIVKSCSMFRLTTGEAKDIFEEMQEIVTRTWKEKLLSTGLNKETVESFALSFLEK